MAFGGVLLAARLTRGVFSGVDKVFTSQKTAKSFDVLRSEAVTDRPKHALDVSKSEFRAARSHMDREKVAAHNDAPASRRDAPPPDSGEKQETRQEDGKKSRRGRFMKFVADYHFNRRFDGRVLAAQSINSGLDRGRRDIDAATTRLIRGDASTSMYDFAPHHQSDNQNTLTGILAQRAFEKLRTKGDSDISTKTDTFHEEFTQRVTAELTKQRGGKVLHDTSTTGQPESTKDSGKPNPIRAKGVTR